MAHPKPGAVPPRPHHISSIAHLFLQDDSVPDPESSVFPGRTCLVAAPGVSPISAFASAGLALAVPGAATLTEDSRLRWSASSFLVSPVGQGRTVSRTGEGDCHTWTIGTAAHEGGGPAAGCRTLDLKHLGCLGPADLSHLESLAATRSLRGFPDEGSIDLVWCLVAEESDRLGSHYTLGRVVELLKPRRISTLVFPDAWARAGQPGWLAEVLREDDLGCPKDIAARVAEMAFHVCGEISMKVHVVSGPDNGRANFNNDASADPFWRRLTLEVLKDPSLCV